MIRRGIVLALFLTALSLAASHVARTGWRSYELQRGLPAFVVALVSAFAAATLLRRDEEAGAEPGESSLGRGELALVAGLTVLAAVLRFVRLSDLPPLAFFDETQNVLAAREILNGSFPVFIGGPTQMPAAAFYLLSAFVLAFGETVTSARFFGATFGVLAVPLFHLLARRFTSPAAAFVATLLFATSRVPLGFTRLGFMGALMPFLTLLSMLLLLRFLRSGRLRDGWQLGAAIGLFAQCYYAFVAFTGVLAAAFALHPGKRPGRRPVLAVALTAALVLVPLAVFAVKHPRAFFERPSTTSLHRHVPREALATAYANNLLATVAMYHFRGDVNPRHNVPDRPLLTSYEAALFTLGLGALAAGFRSFASRAVLVWLVLMLLPGVLTFEAPQAYRTFGALPAVFLAVAFGLEGALRAATRFRPVALSVFAGGALVASLENAVTYFGEQTRGPLVASAFDTRFVSVARFIALATRGAVLLVDRSLTKEGEILLATGGSRLPAGFRRFSPALHLPPGKSFLDDLAGAPELVYVLKPTDERLVPELERLSPGAVIERHHGPDGSLAFVSVRLRLPLTSPVLEPPEPRPHPRS